MARYIDADLLKLQIEQGAEMTERGIRLLDLSQQPTADVAPVVHAHWVSAESKSVGWSVGWDNETFGCPESTCYCSHCGKWLTASDEYHVTGKYCPNCGANMGFVNGQTGGKKDG